MKSTTKALVPAVAVALAVAGCQQGRSKEGDKPPVEKEVLPADTLKEDTMSGFIERMQLWEALHGNTTEMDK